MKIPALTALLGVSILLPPVSGTILLNEININPPPEIDGNYEFIELRSTTNGVESCAGLTLLIIDNTGGQVGEVKEALNLNSYSTGTNGLLLLGNGYDGSPPGGPWSGFKAAATTVADPSGNVPYSGLGDDDIDPNGGLTFLLVTGYTALTNANAVSAPLGDVDINNNSILDWLENPRPAGSQATQPYTTVVDSIGFQDLANARKPYTTADLSTRPGSTPTFAPDNISRRLSRVVVPADQNSSAAWYGGNLVGSEANAVAYSTQFFGDFKGQSTPGAVNLDAAPAVGNFVINEVAINPPGTEDGNFEYIEILNAAAGGGAASLQGLALILLKSNDGDGQAALGTVMEAWDLGTFSTGANGLLLLGNNYPDGNLPWGGYIDPETQLADPAAPGTQPSPARWSSMGDNDIGSNNGFTLLLVQNFTGYVGSAIPAVPPQDLDTNNDGVLDVTPWTSIKDSVGFNQLTPGTGKTYSTARITSAPAYDIDNLSRIRGVTTALSAGAWYGGDYGGKSPFNIGFQNTAALPVIGGFRGAATPGRTNLNAEAVPAAVRLNEVQLDPVAADDAVDEYIELVNTDLTIGGMQGLTLVIADGTAGQENGKVKESIDLSGYSTGPNGLVIIGDGYEDGSPYSLSPLTAAEDPDGFTANDIRPEKGLILLLVKGAQPAENSNISDIAAADIVDSIGFGISPNPAAVLIAPGFEPDNISRYPGNFAPNSAASWFSGELEASLNTTDPYYNISYGAAFSGTYQGGASPGRYNHAATPLRTAALLLNELSINPPGGDGSNEFIEFRAIPGVSTSTNGYTLLTLDNSGGNTGTVVEAWSLDGLATGTNGLLLTGAGYPATLPWTGPKAPAPATRLGSPAGMAPGDIAGYNDNGAASFLLVKNFSGKVGQDLDSTDLGPLNINPPWDAPIADAADIRFWDSTLATLSGIVYGGVNLGQTGYTPDNVSRRGDNSTPLSAAAWYGGDITGGAGTSTTFDLAQRFPAGFDGSVTPGQPNVGAAVDDGGDDDNDTAVNLIEAALNMNPLVPDPEKLPQTGVVVLAGTTYPTLSYSRFSNGSGSGQSYTANGFRYEVQASPDLVTWTGSATPVSVTANPDGVTETAVLRPDTAFFSSAMASGGQIFLRLQVTRL